MNNNNTQHPTATHDAQQNTARVHSIETFGSVDGPGIRFVIFLQGCPMRCQFCHNPDTWAIESTNETTADELLDKAEHFRAYWAGTGGITVSGGEPLLQLPFVTELFRLAKEQQVSTVIDTAGGPFTEDEPFFSAFRALLPLTDLFLLDIKHIDPARHRALTGTSNAPVLALARYLSEQGKSMWIRHVLVPGWTTAADDLHRLADFIGTLRTVERVEVLPYHAMARHKYEALHLPYPLGDTPVPTAEEIARAEAILCGGNDPPRSG